MNNIKLGEVASYINGYAFKPTDWGRNGLPIIRIQDLTGSSYQLNYYDGNYPKKIEINNGDVLISWSASLGVYIWKKGKALLNQHIFKVVFDKKEIDKNYFVYAVQFNLLTMMSYMHGATMKHITKKNFDNIEIPYPTIDQQKKMAQILSKTEIILLNKKSQLKKLDILIKARFVEMFEKEKYKVVTVKDVCAFITKGTTPKSDEIYEKYSKGFVPYLKVYNLSFDGKMLFNKKSQFIESKIHNGILSRSKVYPNDVLMNIVGPPLGKFSLVPKTYDEWNINQAIAIFRATDKIIPEFLLYALMQPKILKSFIDSAVGIRQQNLNLEQCRNLEIPLPPIEIQNQFASFVRQVDKLKTEVQESLDEVQLLFDSLMQKYFG
ncbi:restriction endonuclease subunit S [Pectinatus brassicae]|uniref:Type I restriction enzyme S subunit n=1 Tax=Pectinatus brassicae TaxID=862415 RepID=A0A840UEW2_9FIRM|nr:restriction endonuclease subunit S [Pectinatus brassicae]MBB5336261.1 type I restriction enzyme S subunit [Pectinatus brassicae]